MDYNLHPCSTRLVFVSAPYAARISINWWGLIGLEPTRTISMSLLHPLSDGVRYSIECHLPPSTSAISSQTPQIGSRGAIRTHKEYIVLNDTVVPISLIHTAANSNSMRSPTLYFVSSSLEIICEWCHCRFTNNYLHPMQLDTPIGLFDLTILLNYRLYRRLGRASRPYRQSTIVFQRNLRCSYIYRHAEMSFLITTKWSEWWELNPQSHGPEPCVLPSYTTFCYYP